MGRGLLLVLAVSLWAVVFVAETVSALTLDASRLVYREDFQAEATFPTSPEENTIAAPGLVPDDPSNPPLLSGTAAAAVMSIPGAGSPFVETDTKAVTLELGTSALGVRSFGVRGRFDNLSFTLASDAILPQLDFGIWAAWGPISVLPLASASLVVQRQTPTGPLVARLRILTEDASLVVVIDDVLLPTGQLTQILAGAEVTIDLIVDREAPLVTAILDQVGWATLSVSVPLPSYLAGPPVEISAGAAVQAPSSSLSAATGTSDTNLLELYAEPQVFTVNTLVDDEDDSPGNGACQTARSFCSLRAAIQESNALPGRQRIVVPTGTYVLTRAGAQEDLASTGDLDILGDLEIVGAGAGDTVVDAGGLDRVFDIHSFPVETNVSMSDLTIRNGSASTALQATGGGIENRGALTLTRCEILGNVANLAAGIMNRRSLVMDGCIVADNEALALGFTSAKAGGLASASTSASGLNATAEIRNSAIVRNRAPIVGGVELGNCTSARVENSMIADNQGTQVSVYNCDTVFDHATVTSPTGVALSAGSFAGTNFVELVNTAFEGTPACSLGATLTVVEAGWNASSDASCALTQSQDVVGLPLGLSALVGWSGSQARVPLSGSPLIDSASGSFCLPSDQVGAVRPQDGDGDGGAECDIGAIEVTLPEPAIGLGLAVGGAVLLGLRRRHSGRATTRVD